METVERPEWIRAKVSWGKELDEVRGLLREEGLNSVCVEAACPNKGECWERRHVTFMILGDTCTRKCGFCNVNTGKISSIDEGEPCRIGKAVKRLGIKYAVITSVTRDDLPDRGAGHFEKTVGEIKSASPDTLVELLIPDLDADISLIRKAAFSGAEVIGHNIEMPEDLYRDVRPGADYERSINTLNILDLMKKEGAGILVKSSMIVGLGELTEDIFRTLRDLKTAGVDIVYIGQYLSPTNGHWPVKKYYAPEEFRSLEEEARNIGFRSVFAGPMVRSSYRAHDAYHKYSE